MNDKDAINTPVCTGACLFGKCPHKVCLRYLQQQKKAVQLKADMNILTAGMLPDIKSDKTGYGVAVDIGTTTVVMYLYDCASGRQLGCLSRLNAQATLGVDVISRIKYCREFKDGLHILNDAIVTLINQLLDDITGGKINKDEISHIVITGNTTMLHLFSNISPVTMGVSPFTPASLFGYICNAAGLGLRLADAEAYLVPCISAFVGGDITSGILASGMFESDDLCVLLDIGTNGEVALGNKHGILATSTAAGPAFEGAHISRGMAGVGGAINSVYAFDGTVKVTTIGGKDPKGLCGSGLLDAVALMLDIGLVDETGRIADQTEAVSLKGYITEADGEAALKIYEDIV
ncbi:MAG: ASKHA domain-containing protein, partial [Eubacteriales bacterium]|nr:ASKHA domain-containing protein [Eubacteriales bacterium]